MLITTPDLFNNERVVWQVLVECIDHPIAIAPGVPNGSIAFQARGFAIAGKIQPMASPTFAVALVSQ